MRRGTAFRQSQLFTSARMLIFEVTESLLGGDRGLFLHRAHARFRGGCRRVRRADIAALLCFQHFVSFIYVFLEDVRAFGTLWHD